MRYNQLGRSGLFVSELCLGTMTFGGQDHAFWQQIGTLELDAVNALVKRSLDAGINFIDTADVYSDGRSEELLGESLKNLGVNRSEVVIATKFYGGMGKGPNDRGGSRAHIMDAVAKSLKRLGTDYIDLYQIHNNDPVTPIEETLRALDDLVSRGLVRYIGCSNWPAWRMAKALAISDIAATCATRRRSPTTRSPAATWSARSCRCFSKRRWGSWCGARSPAGCFRESSGLARRQPMRDGRTSIFRPSIATGHGRASRRCGRSRDAKGVSVAQVALAWLLHKPYVTSIIVGAKRVEQLDDNIAAVTFSLSAEEMAALDAVSALPEEYPGWMMARQGPGRWPAAVKPDRTLARMERSEIRGLRCRTALRIALRFIRATRSRCAHDFSHFAAAEEDINLAVIVHPEGVDLAEVAEAVTQVDNILGAAVGVAERVDGSAAKIAEEIAAGDLGDRLAAIDVAAGDRAALGMRVFVDRHDESVLVAAARAARSNGGPPSCSSRGSRRRREIVTTWISSNAFWPTSAM